MKMETLAWLPSEDFPEFFLPDNYWLLTNDVERVVKSSSTDIVFPSSKETSIQEFTSYWNQTKNQLPQALSIATAFLNSHPNYNRFVKLKAPLVGSFSLDPYDFSFNTRTALNESTHVLGLGCVIQEPHLANHNISLSQLETTLSLYESVFAVSSTYRSAIVRWAANEYRPDLKTIILSDNLYAERTTNRRFRICWDPKKVLRCRQARTAHRKKKVKSRDLICLHPQLNDLTKMLYLSVYNQIKSKIAGVVPLIQNPRVRKTEDSVVVDFSHFAQLLFIHKKNKLRPSYRKNKEWSSTLISLLGGLPDMKPIINYHYRPSKIGNSKSLYPRTIDPKFNYCIAWINEEIQLLLERKQQRSWRDKCRRMKKKTLKTTTPITE